MHPSGKPVTVERHDKMNAAQEWINTDNNACLADVKRLGLDGATDYQMNLIIDRSASGDTRWDEITEKEMKAALEELANS